MNMKKEYIVPQVEVMQLSSQIIMDTINVINHSGGGPGGFDESNII